MASRSVATALAISASCACTARTDLFVAPDDDTEVSQLQPLAIESVTPNAITVAWDPAALGDGVNGYLLHYGTDEGSVRDGGGELWDAQDDPNLDWGISPFGPQVIHRTTLSDLVAGTTYFVELFARYDTGPSPAVAFGAATTPTPAAGSVTIFADALSAGYFAYELEGEGDVVASPVANPHSGTAALGFVGNGAWVNIKLRDLAIDLSPLGAGAWNSAYVEFFLNVGQSDGSALPVPYVELALGAPAVPSFDYGYPFYATLPDRSGWHRIQVPLASLVQGGLPMSAAAFGSSLDRLVIGFESPDNGEVYLDDVVIHY